MSRLRLAPIGLLSTILLSACVGVGASPGASAAPSADPGTSPGPSQAASPSSGALIGHPTGPKDVILRMATGGGFVAPGTLLTEIPEFSLYGDGTVVVRDPATSYVEPSPASGVARRTPFQTARLSEAEVQRILADAIGPGGIGDAKDVYVPCCVADAPSTTFTLEASGLDKTVTVGALGIEAPSQGTDQAERKAFQELAGRLVGLDLGSSRPATYEPAAYRGILSDAASPDPSVQTRPWPWTGFGPDGFTSSSAPGAMPIPTRTLSAADVEALGITDLEGGADAIALKTAAGKVYLLALRPLLPDERS